MKKLTIFTSSLFLVLSLTGCVRLTADLEVNKDSTISGSMIFAVSDTLAGFGGTSSDINNNDLIDAKAKGVTIEKYNEGGFTGQKYLLDHVPFSEFKSSKPEESFNFSKEGKKIKVSGVMDLSDSSGTSGSSDQITQDMAKAIMAGADLRISIKFPYEVTETSGELSSDKHTVTWRPKFGEKTNLEATIKIPSINPAPFVFGAILLLIILVLFLKFRKITNPENELDIAVEQDA